MHNQINDTSICLNTLVIFTAWGVGLALILINIAGFVPVGVAALGLASVCLGALRSIAAMLCDLERREQAAFNLGRETARIDLVRTPRG